MPGETEPRLTNQIALTLAPRMTNLPLRVPRAGDGSASFAIAFTPELRPGQHAVLVLGTTEHLPQDGVSSPGAELVFAIPDAPVGVHLARLRVDGIESPIIDLSAPPPAIPRFLDQTVEFT